MCRITVSAFVGAQKLDTEALWALVQKSSAPCILQIDTGTKISLYAGCHPQELHTAQHLGLLREDWVQDHGQHHRDGPREHDAACG